MTEEERIRRDVERAKMDRKWSRPPTPMFLPGMMGLSYGEYEEWDKLTSLLPPGRQFPVEPTL